MVLVGSPGVGKTHIAVALGDEAVRARKLTYFVDCQRPVGDLKRAAGKGALERRMRFYSHLSLLIVDEVGYLDVDKEGRMLFQPVSRRNDGKPAIAAANVGIDAWAKVFGDPVAASAIAATPNGAFSLPFIFDPRGGRPARFTANRPQTVVQQLKEGIYLWVHFTSRRAFRLSPPKLLAELFKQPKRPPASAGGPKQTAVCAINQSRRPQPDLADSNNGNTVARSRADRAGAGATRTLRPGAIQAPHLA